jgi:hypothetical protein
MRVTDALGQIAVIHQQLAKGEVYRGFHPPGVALAGLAGAAAGFAQPWLVAADDPTGFVRYWLAVAAVCCLIGAAAPLGSYFRRDDEFARRRSRQVAGQFGPCVVAGLAVTLAAGRAAEIVPYLPGLWSLAFGLGVFAARPYLPHATGWVGLYYLAAGAILLAAAPSDLAGAGRAVGTVFAAGHLGTAWVLRRNLERDADD